VHRGLLRTSIGVSVLALAVACNGRHHVAAPSSTSAPPVWVDARCPQPYAQFSSGGGSIPSGFQITEILECVNVTRVVPGRGQWSAVQEERATGGFAAFVTALQQPSQQTPHNAPMACAGTGLSAVVVLADSRGRALIPAWPTDMCGNPQQGALDALGRVPFRTISTTLITQVESQLAYTSGCYDSAKDILSWEPNGGLRSSWPGPEDHHLLVCLYSVSPPAFGDMPGPTGPEVVGQLIGAGTLPDSDLTALRTELAQARPAGDCRTPHSQFALVTRPVYDDPGGPQGYLEMNGCDRWQGPRGVDLTLGQQTIAMIRSVARSD
jgi:hypothetical protein